MFYKKGMFKGNKITLMGLGLLGRGVGDAEFFAKEGAELIVTDLKTKSELKESLDKLRKYKNIKYRLGGHNIKDFEGRDFILKAAGVPLDSPYIKHAKDKGIPIIMSTALFALLSPAKIIGVTGTRGKSTVTAMIYEIIRQDKKRKGKVYLGGNVQGVATLPLLSKVKSGDMVVLELDSWQLQGFGDLRTSPGVSVFTTFMPDHLNYYKGDLNKYFEDKANIYRNQRGEDIFIAGEQLCSLPVNFTKKLPKGTHFVSERALPKNVSLRIPGEHNVYNAALAFEVTRTMKVPRNTIVSALEKFRGVSGRLEKISKIRGIEIYNDTTATTPHATVAALEALGKMKNIALILGGTDKGIDLKVLRDPIKQSCSSVSLLKGTGTDRLLSERIIGKNINYEIFSTLEKALQNALKTVPKDGIVLFSPGFTSFGMFKNEYDRGEKFVDLVKNECLKRK